MLCILYSHELQRFNSRCTAAYHYDPLPLCVLAIQLAGVIYLALELLLAWNMGHFGFSACTNRRNDAIEAPVGGVVDDPSSLIILVDLCDVCIKLCTLIEPVSLPKLLDLGDDLFAIRVATTPSHGGMKSVHEAVDLEAGSIVDFLQTQLAIAIFSFELGVGRTLHIPPSVSRSPFSKI